MSSSNLFRWSGLAAILGGVLLPLSWVLRFVAGAQRPVTGTVEFVGTILLVFGFIGVYGFQSQETGIPGFLGFLLVTLSNCLALGECWLQNGTPTGAGDEKLFVQRSVLFLRRDDILGATDRLG